MKRIIIRFILIVPVLAAMVAGCRTYGSGSGDLPAYRIFTSEGARTDYAAMLVSLSGAEIIFIGETHNCPIAHWMELEITKALFQKDSAGLVLGAEMFERDDQYLVDAYLSRELDSDGFEEKARLWDNYWTDYYPLLFFAKDNGLKFIATNVPRRYAAYVKDNGLEALESLPEEDRQFIAPLPIDFEPDEDTEEMFSLMKMMMGHDSGTKSYYAEAQAVKDATMAWSVAENFEKRFIHYNGNFHSDMHGGIIPYLERYLPGKRIVTVCCARQDEIEELDEENIGRADFIICVPTDMTMTF